MDPRIVDILCKEAQELSANKQAAEEFRQQHSNPHKRPPSLLPLLTMMGIAGAFAIPTHRRGR